MIKRMTFNIIGMECPQCSMILESIEEKLKGVKKAEASYRKAQLVVEYDASQLTREEIKTEVIRLGYEVTSQM